jgi:hypothetical protein
MVHSMYYINCCLSKILNNCLIDNRWDCNIQEHAMDYGLSTMDFR